MAASLGDLVGLSLSGDRYLVLAKLGEGGMGFVYRARDRNLDAEVVIKVPRRAMLEDPEFADRFAREVRALVKLAHPNIVRITDVGEHEGLPFAVMQYLPGGSLDDRRPRGADGQASPMPVGTLAAWLPGVAAALDFVHEAGYVHRDVKPANVLFDAHGHVYLSDFGVAKALSSVAEAKAATGTGMVLGTPEYMAPELVMGQPFDGRVDQYALAVAVYEWLGGRRPFEGPTGTAILVQQTTREPTPLHEVQPAVPPSLSAALHRALAKDPERRYPDCTGLARALTAGGETLSGTALRAGSGTSARLKCPVCGAIVHVTDAARGRKGRCPACSTKFLVGQDLGQLHPLPREGEAAKGASSSGQTVPLVAPRAPSRETVAERVPAATVREAAPAASPKLPDDFYEVETPGIPRAPIPARVAVSVVEEPVRRPASRGSSGHLSLIGVGVGAALLACVAVGAIYAGRVMHNGMEANRERERVTTRRVTPDVVKARTKSIPPMMKPDPASDSVRVEALLTSAEALIRRGEPVLAVKPLNDYVGEDKAARKDWARRLLTEIDLATSDEKARALLRSMSDDELTRLAGDPTFGTHLDPIQDASLRTVYAATLRRNLTAEQFERRKATGTLADAGASKGSRGRVERVPIEKFLGSPEEFAGKTVIPERYVLIGTRAEPFDEGTVVLPMTKFDQQRLPTGTQYGNERVTIVVDSGVADQLRLYRENEKVRASVTPKLKTALTLEVSGRRGDKGPEWVAVAREMEIFMACNPEKIAKDVYGGAVGTLKLRPDGYEEGLGDGDEWIKRLGGQTFVDRVKNQVKEQRKKFSVALRKQEADAMYNQAMSTMKKIGEQNDLAGQSFMRKFLSGNAFR